MCARVFWVAALIIMSIYMAECLSGSGSICACALMLFLVVYWSAIYGYIFEMIIFGCVHCGLVVRALVKNRKSAVRVPHHGGFLAVVFTEQCLRASSWRFA